MLTGGAWDLKVPVWDQNRFSDVAGGLVQISGKLPISSEAPDDTDVGSEIKQRKRSKPIGILHLFQSEANWKPPISKTKASHPAKIASPNHARLAHSQKVINSIVVPRKQSEPSKIVQFQARTHDKKRTLHRRKKLSPVTLLRAYENTILIKDQGHFADERELASLKSTSNGLRCAVALRSSQPSDLSRLIVNVTEGRKIRSGGGRRG